MLGQSEEKAQDFQSKALQEVIRRKATKIPKAIKQFFQEPGFSACLEQVGSPWGSPRRSGLPLLHSPSTELIHDPSDVIVHYLAWREKWSYRSTFIGMEGLHRWFGYRERVLETHIRDRKAFLYFLLFIADRVDLRPGWHGRAEGIIRKYDLEVINEASTSPVGNDRSTLSPDRGQRNSARAS